MDRWSLRQAFSFSPEDSTRLVRGVVVCAKPEQEREEAAGHNNAAGSAALAVEACAAAAAPDERGHLRSVVSSRQHSGSNLLGSFEPGFE